MPAGRPTDYEPQFADEAIRLCNEGATDKELAEIFGVDISTLYRWKHAQPRFRDALKIGKEPADDRVERTLYQKALDGDTVSMIFWLKNRKPNEWRDRKDPPPPNSDDESLLRAKLAALLESHDPR